MKVCDRCVDLQRRLEEITEQRNRLYQRNHFEAGGVFRRRTREEMGESELVESIHLDHYENAFTIELTPLARTTFGAVGSHIRVDAFRNEARQGNIRAENWWHLCAKTGLTEVEARIFYHNPEMGQESAVKRAKPYRPGAVISCQGDYLD